MGAGMNLFPLIEGKLYQAGSEMEITTIFMNRKPTVVIDCLPGLPHLGLNVEDIFIKIPFRDAPLPFGPNGMRLVTRMCDVARMAACLIRNGEVVLTHCSPTENRCSLVNGLILLELRNMGMLTFKRAVDFIHNVRPDALTNTSFIAYLDNKYARS